MRELKEQLNRIERKLDKIMIDQATFDTDLASLVTAIGNFITAVNAKIAATPPADFTAEDASVQAAAKTVADALNALNPPTPVPPVTPPPTS